MDYPKSLVDLPYDVIILILQKLDIKSLGRLTRTCKKFKSLIDEDGYIWVKRSLKAFGSNMSSAAMEVRCKPILSHKNRCRISKAWSRQLGDIGDVASYKRCMPCLVLERDFLYFSQCRTVQKHARLANGNTNYHYDISRAPFKDDISEISVNEFEVVCGGRDGGIVRYHKDTLSLIDSFVSHNGEEVFSVATKQDIIISGAEKSLKIFKCTNSPMQHQTELKTEISTKNKCLSISFMQFSNLFAVGTPGTKNVHPLQLFDLEREKHIADLGDTYRNGAGILDIVPESFNTIFSCGYDTTLRLWDVRYPQNSVAMWTEPFDSTMYCVQTDHNVTMITGTCHSGCFSVWDKRLYRKPVKIYHVQKGRGRGIRNQREAISTPYFFQGPVYDVDFDAAHIYCAFDTTLLEFSYMGSFII